MILITNSPVPDWARINERIASFLRDNKWFDILSGKDGKLQLVEVKSRNLDVSMSSLLYHFRTSIVSTSAIARRFHGKPRPKITSKPSWRVDF